MRLLHSLRKAGLSLATSEEQAVLGRWSGWGALPSIFAAQPVRAGFDSDDAHAKVLKRWASLATEREEVRSLLTEPEWNAASRNTLNAHYTDIGLVRPIWQTVRRLGFDGGTVLEPGCGSGNFIALAPQDTGTPVRMTGVEVDRTTAGIASLLHPDAVICAKGFETLRLRAGRYQAAIGNVPFGDYPVFDEVHNPNLKFNIHNHFILKALHAVEPGGVVALVTSRWTLDAQKDDARRAIHGLGDLVGAVRLPAGAHKTAAGTDVVTDVLFLRRRADGDPPGDEGWLRTETLELPGHHQPVEVNSYFLDHPEQVVGDLRSRMGRFGPELTVISDPDAVVADGLAAAAARIGVAAEPLIEFDDADLPDGALSLDASGNPTVAEDGVMVPVGIHQGQLAQLVELIRLKHLTNRLYAAEATSSSQTETPQLAGHRAQLRDALRTYRRRHPPLTKPGQYRIFTPPEAKDRAKAEGVKPIPDEWKQRTAYSWIDDDPDSALLFGLEVWDERAGKGIEQKVLHDRVLAPRVLPTRAETPEDAIAIALEHDGGHLDINRVATLLDVSAFEAADSVETAGLAYRDPERLGTWEPRHLYLSGNVKTKLAAARAAADSDPTYQANVAALEAVQPSDLHPSEIKAKVGAPWIPTEVYTAFLRQLGFRDAVVKHAGGTAWEVSGKTTKYGDLAVVEWGTKDRNTCDLFSKLLAQAESTVTVTRTERDRSYVDREATDAAREKAHDITTAFDDWVWADQDRAQQLAGIYNEKFNNLVAVEFDTAALTLPGLVAGWTMRPHQNAAIRRILASNTALLAHVVGAGKTATMVAAAMELRRTGLAKKPAIVVPNHMLKQWTREFRQLYPNAKLLAITASDLGDKRRKKFMARIAGGEWDAVVLTHRAFERIPLRPQTQTDYIDREMANLRDQVSRAQEIGMDDRKVKQIETALVKAESKVKQKIAKTSDRNGVYLEDTGLDYVFVDESHEFKNLRTISAIEGAAIDGAAKATKLHMLLDYLRRSNRTGRVATFATGTPIANSVTEAYVLMRYMVPDVLAETELDAFDNWAATFGSVVSSLEPDPKGGGYKFKARFARFFNVPELLSVYWGFADVQTADDLGLPTPPVRAGDDGQRGERFLIPRSAEQAQFVKLLPSQPWVHRPGGVVKALGQGLRASLDMGLVGYGSDDGSKLPVAAEQIAEIWRQTRDVTYPRSRDDPTPQELPGSLQLVFLDDGTPKSKAEYAVNLYDELRERLVAYGMPRDSIRFMHDASTDTKKDKLFADCRSGRVTVLIGSTPTMGTGTNVQDRGIALHHLSYPWKPADMAQRDGRVERQGNLNHPDIEGTPDEIRIVYYITERTFDEFRLNTIARKARFINQMQKRGFNLREIEDIGEDAVNFSMLTALASGDPTLLKLAEATAERARLEGLTRTWDRQQDDRAAEMRSIDDWLQHAAPAVETMRAAAAKRTTTTGDRFAMTVEGRTFHKRADAADALTTQLLRIAEAPPSDDAVFVGTLGNLPVLTDFHSNLATGFIGFDWIYSDHSRPQTAWKASNLKRSSEASADASDERGETGGQRDDLAWKVIRTLEGFLARLDEAITKTDAGIVNSRAERAILAGRLSSKDDNPYRHKARSKAREERLLGKLIVANEQHATLLAQATGDVIPEETREGLRQISAEVDRLKRDVANEHRIQAGEEPEVISDPKPPPPQATDTPHPPVEAGGDDDQIDEPTAEPSATSPAPASTEHARQLVATEVPELAGTDEPDSIETVESQSAVIEPALPQSSSSEVISPGVVDGTQTVSVSRFPAVADVLAHWFTGADNYRLAETRAESATRIRAAARLAENIDPATAAIVAGNFVVAGAPGNIWLVLHVGTALRVTDATTDRDTAYRYAKALASWNSPDEPPFDWSSDGLRDRLRSIEGRRMLDAVTGCDTEAMWNATAPSNAQTHVCGDQTYRYAETGHRINVYDPDGVMIAIGSGRRDPTRYSSVWITEMRDGRKVPGSTRPGDIVDHVARQHLLANADPANRDPIWVHYDDGRAHIHGAESGDELKNLMRSCGFTWSGHAKAWVIPSTTLPYTAAMSVAKFVNTMASQGRIVEIRPDENRLRLNPGTALPAGHLSGHTDTDRADQQQDGSRGPAQGRSNVVGRYASVATAAAHLRGGGLKPARWAQPPRMHGDVTVRGATSEENAKARINSASEVFHHYEIARTSQISTGGRFLITRARPNAVWEVFHIYSGTVMTHGAGHPNKDAALNFANRLEAACDSDGAPIDWESPHLGDRLKLHTGRDELDTAIDRSRRSAPSSDARAPADSGPEPSTTHSSDGFMTGRTIPRSRAAGRTYGMRR